MYEQCVNTAHSLFAHAAIRIEQRFPLNASYSCHCPNIKLRCTFPENSKDAFWTVLDSGVPSIVTNTTLGHTVTYDLSHGRLFLEVHDTTYSENNTYVYRCNVKYDDSDGIRIKQSETFLMREVEG